jgi:hydrogenase expression/formation protein HypE
VEVLLRSGKLPPELLRELLAAGAPLPEEVRLGPAIGEDACAIDLAQGTLIAATDPITLTGQDVAAHAAVINANDVAVMGVRPRWFMSTIMLPIGTTASDVRALFASLHLALEDLGVALVGGHTEVTAAVNQPVVVGQMMGFSPEGRFLPTGGVTPGDVIVQAGEAPIEAAAILAGLPDPRLAQLGSEGVKQARAALVTPGISVVEAALLATEIGATALHDPTESGLSGGLYELAEASGVRIVLKQEAPLWFEAGCVVCEALGVNPWGALASGALLAAFPAADAEDAVRKLKALGTPALVIGVAEAGSGVTRSDGKPLANFSRDEVARVFDEALSQP